MADRFAISLRTVYRDVKALEESGVPVIGEAGSGYSIMEGYRLPPVMFTQEEAAALLMGGKLASKLTDASVQKHFDEALFKIKAVLRTADKDSVEWLDAHIEVSRRQNLQDESNSKHLAALQKSIIDKRVIFIRYQSNNKDEITERMVEPIGLWYYGNNWHLIGWCRLRQGYRDFRISRLQRLQVKDETFSPRSYQSLKEYINSFADMEQQLQEMVVVFDRSVLPFLGDQKYNFGFVRQEEYEGDKVRMYFLTLHPEGFGRWLLTYTNMARVESPALLQDIMEELAQEIAAHYSLSKLI